MAKGKKNHGKNNQIQGDEAFVYPIDKFKIDPQVVEDAEYLISYYRQFPYVFSEQYLGIKLYDYQKILLYEMMHKHNFIFAGCRNIAKTYITALYICTRCILYPKTKVIITAKERQQAVESITKIKDMMKDSPALRDEISDCSDSVNTPRVLFWNGSTVRIATMSEGSRHYRGNLIIVDEYVTADVNIINSVITAFMGDPRNPNYLKSPEYFGKDEYEYLKEKDTEIYLSSVGHKSSWAYRLFDDYFKNMVKGDKDFFVCALPYQTAVKSGLRKIDHYRKEMSKSTVDEQVFNAEYSCVWMNDAENGFYKYDMLDNCRSLNKATYLNDLQEFLANRDRKYSNKRKPKDVIRILGADIAAVGGKKNDLSAYCILQLIEKNKTVKTIVDDRETTTVVKYYDRELIYLESHEGMLVKDQALRLKKLFFQYECNYIVVDAMNCGSTVIQLIGEPTFDMETGEEYPPLMSMEDDDYAKMCQYSYAKKVLKPINASAQSNHDMADKLLGHINQKHIKLLINDGTGKDFLRSIKGYDDDNDAFTKDVKERLLKPYMETKWLIEEMIALERVPTPNNLIRLKEPTGKRKDRYSAFLYSNGYADELQAKLINTFDYDPDDDIDWYFEA